MDVRLICVEKHTCAVDSKFFDLLFLTMYNMNVIYIVVFVIIAVVTIFLTIQKESYWDDTYVMTPNFSGVYPTDVTDWWWYDRYIQQPQIRYAVVPYWNFPRFRRHRRW